MKLLRWLLIFASLPAFGQAVRYSDNVYTINASAPQPGALYPVLANTSATIQICTYSTTQSCPALVTTYTDATASTPCPTATQLTASNSGTCTASVDAEGSFGIWLLAGTYQYMVTTTYGTFGPYDFTVGVNGSGGGGGVAWLNVLTYGADPSCTTDSTTAFQAAYTAAEASIVKSVALPAIYVPHGCYLVEGLRWSGDITVFGDSRDTSIIQPTSNTNVFTILPATLVTGSSSNQGGISDIGFSCPTGHAYSSTLIELQNSTAFSVQRISQSGCAGRGVATVNNTERIYLHDIISTNIRWPVVMTGDKNTLDQFHSSGAGLSADGYCWENNWGFRGSSNVLCPNGNMPMYGVTNTQTLNSAVGTGATVTYVVTGDTTGGTTQSNVNGGPGISPIFVGNLFTVAGATGTTCPNGAMVAATVANHTPTSGQYAITATSAINQTTGQPISTLSCSGTATVGSATFQPTFVPALNPAIYVNGQNPIVSARDINIDWSAGIAGQPSGGQFIAPYIENNLTNNGEPQLNAALLDTSEPYFAATTGALPGNTSATTTTVHDTLWFNAHVTTATDAPGAGNFPVYRILPCDYLAGSVSASTCSGLSGVQRGQFEQVQGMSTGDTGFYIAARCLSGSTAPCSTAWPVGSWIGETASQSLDTTSLIGFGGVTEPPASSVYAALAIDGTPYEVAPMILGNIVNGLTSFTAGQAQSISGLGGITQGNATWLGGPLSAGGTELIPASGFKTSGDGTRGLFLLGGNGPTNPYSQDVNFTTGNITHGQAGVINAQMLDGSYPQLAIKNLTDFTSINTQFLASNSSESCSKMVDSPNDPLTSGDGYSYGPQYCNQYWFYDTSASTNGKVNWKWGGTGGPFNPAFFGVKYWNGSSWLTTFQTDPLSGNTGIASGAVFRFGLPVGQAGMSSPSFDQFSFGNGTYGDTTAQLNAGNLVLNSTVPQIIEATSSSTQGTAIQLLNSSPGACGWVWQSEGSTNTTPGSMSFLDNCGNTVPLRLNFNAITAYQPVTAPSFIANGAGAGFLDLAFGAAPSAAPTGNFQQYAAASGTAYSIVWPGAQASGSNTFLSCTAANPSVCSWAAGGGGGSFSALTGDATSTSTGGATTVVGINGTLLSGLSTGLAKITTTTGAVTTVAAPAGAVVGTTDTQTLTNKTINGSQLVASSVANAALANPATTVNGQTCTLGSTCTVTAVPSATITIAQGGTNATSAAAGTVPNASSSSASTWTATPTLGVDNSVAGTEQLSNGTASAHTIVGSAATTSNTVKWFATAPTTGDLVDCVTASTTCTLTDAGILAANVVTLTGSQTLTNKTLTAPVIATIVNTGTLTLPTTTATLSETIANGTSAMGTGAISSATCATVVTTTATGTATTDVVSWGFNGDPTGVTGYAPVTTGALTIFAYPTTNNVSFKVCNLTTASITPGAITLNWRVVR